MDDTKGDCWQAALEEAARKNGANPDLRGCYSSLSRSSVDANESSRAVNFPTRAQQKLSGPATDPLHYVTAQSAAMALAEHAKTIMSISEQQNRRRNQQVETTPRFEEEETWMSDLDTWRRKRRQKKSDDFVEESEKPEERQV
ncbi:unnamed protein product, partial [Mesorhabditis spiculigera]